MELLVVMQLHQIRLKGDFLFLFSRDIFSVVYKYL